MSRPTSLRHRLIRLLAGRQCVILNAHFEDGEVRKRHPDSAALVCDCLSIGPNAPTLVLMMKTRRAGEVATLRW